MIGAHRRLATLALLAVAAVSPGQAAAGTADDLSLRAKRVGVLVLAGHRVEMLRIGFTLFGNKRDLVAAPDDALAETVFQIMKAQLEQERRWEIVRVAVPDEQLADVADKAQRAAGALFRSDLKPIREELLAVGRTCGCDALLVAAAARGGVAPTSNQSVEGFSWVWWGSYTSAHANLDLHLVDPATGESAGHAVTSTDRSLMPPRRPMALYWTAETPSIDGTAWPVLLAAFRDALRDTVRLPLYSLGLRPSCGTYFKTTLHRPNYAQRNTEPASAYELPPMPPGADPSKCDAR